MTRARTEEAPHDLGFEQAVPFQQRQEFSISGKRMMKVALE